MPNFEKFHAQVMHALIGKTDIERSESPLLHDEWQQDGHYAVGNVVRRGEQLYKCLLEHNSQPTWTPEDSPSLWAKVMYREGIRIIPEIITATEAFALDEQGWWGDTVYRSLINGNVYNPEQYPPGWEDEVAGDDDNTLSI